MLLPLANDQENRDDEDGESDEHDADDDDSDGVLWQSWDSQRHGLNAGPCNSYLHPKPWTFAHCKRLLEP